MRRVYVLSLLIAAFSFAATPEWTRANGLYQRTEYAQSLAILLGAPYKDAPTLQLIGQNWFMLGEYKKASDALEKGVAMDPNNARLVYWLGRTYGRRAETANPFAAPGLASKARQLFEKAVQLDPSDKDALGDLLDFYLEAPGFLGGGVPKAEALAQAILKQDQAEGHYAQGIVADRKKEYDAAEQQFRRAAELAPRQVGRILVLARYLANHGRVKESDALFEQAAGMAPNNPRVLFDRAATYIKEKRDLDVARELLKRFLDSPLTPDDPPRERAEALLKKIGA
jgi:tetratricopeptide (TPR) repeat protein